MHEVHCVYVGVTGYELCPPHPPKIKRAIKLKLDICVFMFELNVPPTAKIIYGDRTMFYLTDWRSQGWNLRPLVYKASGLFTTQQQLLKLEL